MSDPLPQILRALGFVLLQHRGQGLFTLLSPPPEWLVDLWQLPPEGAKPIAIAEKSPFLETFLFEADAFSNANQHGLCQSETWVEMSSSGKEFPLQAVALQLEGKRFLALRSPQPEFEERARLLQTARNSLLDHEKLQREIQKKEILLHCIIHDLSQPLSVMSVAFDCISAERVSERAKGLLELGRKASDQQLTMISDILRVFSADLQATMQPANPDSSTADLVACAQSVLNAFTPVYATKNVQLRSSGFTPLPSSLQVRGESARIERIFSNLLENALRYSPPGTTVTFAVEPDGDFAKAYIDDQGPGLPPDLPQKQIFALFSKGKQGGGKAGLGLYFCRLTVERWGGTIGCESLPQAGSRFWFRLPIAAESMVAPNADRPTSQVNSSTTSHAKKHLMRMRILLADDQDEIRMLTTLQLERSGHKVTAVANGREALDATQREQFDIILLDEDMPVMGGLEALHAIRERHKTGGSTTIVAVTGYNSDADRARLLQAGFDEVIGKPFRLDALDVLLRSVSPNTTPTRAAEPPPKSPESPYTNLLDRVGGDEKLARKMIATFLRDTPKRIAALDQALQQDQSQSVASLAHALKGSVAIFGAQAARDHAEKLQDLGRAGRLHGASDAFRSLKEDIAELEQNLRGYAGQKRSPSQGARSKIRRRIST
jgi:signal transduction histidine kinase/CheY-like chemotaxis protein